MRSEAWPAWILVLWGVFLGGCSGANPAEDEVVPVDDRVEIQTTVVRRSPITATLETVGTLLPARSATIVSGVDGVIKSLPDSGRVVEYEEDGQKKTFALSLDIGTPVDEGDVLVQLDRTDFELALEEAQARFNSLMKRLEDLLAWKREEEVRQLEAQVEEARAAWELAQADLRRNERLLATGATTPGDHDAARATARRAQAALAQAEAALALAEAGPTDEQVAVAQAELEAAQVEVKRRQRDLEKTTIRSPYPAVIAERYVGVGDRVTAMPRVEIMKIVDPRMLFVEIDVPERYVNVVKLKDVAEVDLPSRPESVHGKVELIGGRIDAETRTFRVRVGIDNRQGRFKPGGFVRVKLPIRSAEDALVVPRTALSFSEGQPAAFVYREEGFVQRRPVRLGITTDASCEILDGLSEGEIIAASNTAILADGLAVRRQGAANIDAGRSESSRPTASTGHKPVGRFKLGQPPTMRKEKRAS